MIPYLLAIAGGYLIAQSRKQDTFADGGGKMADGGMAEGGMIWASPTLRKKYEFAFGKDFKPEYAIESSKKESLIESYYWNYLLDVLEIEELDEKVANDWKVATEVEDGKLVQKGPYRTRYMYSPSLDRLREQNEGEWYSYGSVSDTFADGGIMVEKMADGGSMDVVNAEISTIKRNIMGTTSFVMKIKGMRNPQDFIVYPISADQAGKPIMIQSDTRFGFLDLSSGRGLMSQSHANGAYSYHFTMDKKVPFKISETDLQRLKDNISDTAGSRVGSKGIVSDNSGANLMAKGGSISKADVVDTIKKLKSVVEEIKYYKEQIESDEVSEVEKDIYQNKLPDLYANESHLANRLRYEVRIYVIDKGKPVALSQSEYDFSKSYLKKGGSIESIEEALERFDVTNLDAFEKMQYDNFSKSVGKQQALQVLINSVEGDYSQLSPDLRAIAEKFKMAKGGKFEYKSTEVKSRVQVGGFYIYSDYNDNPYETNPDRKFIAYIPAFAEDGYFPYSAYPTRAEAVENAREYYQGDFDAGKFEPTEDYVKRLKKKSGNTMKSGGKVKKYKYYIEFLNKKKGFSRDKKVFDTEEEAVRWGRKNLERFNYDMLKIEFD